MCTELRGNFYSDMKMSKRAKIVRRGEGPKKGGRAKREKGRGVTCLALTTYGPFCIEVFIN